MKKETTRKTEVTVKSDIETKETKEVPNLFKDDVEKAAIHIWCKYGRFEGKKEALNNWFDVGRIWDIVDKFEGMKRTDKVPYFETICPTISQDERAYSRKMYKMKDVVEQWLNTVGENLYTSHPRLVCQVVAKWVKEGKPGKDKNDKNDKNNKKRVELTALEIATKGLEMIQRAFRKANFNEKLAIKSMLKPEIEEQFRKLVEEQRQLNDKEGIKNVA